jgi:hypothetical protein
MGHWLIRLAIFGAIAAGMSGVALAQTCPPPGSMLQDSACYAPTTPAAIARIADGFHNGRVNRSGLPAAQPNVVRRRAPPEALGSAVVLRGSLPANPNVGQPIPGGSGEGYGSTDDGPPGPRCPIGWDCDHETIGFDRSGLDP